MLTKQEREAIAERLKNVSVLDGDYAVYQAVTGKSVLYGSPTLGDIHDMRSVILDLCDTSNMVELPIDKDGEIIRIGDTVINGAGGRICRVSGYDFKSDGCSVLLNGNGVYGWTYSRPDVLTHKKPVTIESLVERFRHVLNKGHMSAWSMAELINIADQLESLGDSDD